MNAAVLPFHRSFTCIHQQSRPAIATVSAQPAFMSRCIVSSLIRCNPEAKEFVTETLKTSETPPKEGESKAASALASLDALLERPPAPSSPSSPPSSSSPLPSSAAASFKLQVNAKLQAIAQAAASGETSTTESTPAPPSDAQSESEGSGKIKKAMSSLDALLGIVDEPPASSSSTANKQQGPTTSISQSALDKIAEAEAQRASSLSKENKPNLGGVGASPDSQLEDQFQRIIAKVCMHEKGEEGGGGHAMKCIAGIRRTLYDLL